MPFTNAYHGGDREPADLGARIDAELRARIEDAVDFACLDVMVDARKTRDAPAPAAENVRDREEYTARVASFLEHLRRELIANLSAEQRQRLGGTVVRDAPRDIAAAVDVQIALAKELPDYWQRFDAIRLNALSEIGGSRGQRRSLLDWLLGRG